jgi:hypothetical protein
MSTIPVKDDTPRPPEARPMVDTEDAQPAVRVPFVDDRDHDAGRLDAAAGCEFVDDRIRRVE